WCVDRTLILPGAAEDARILRLRGRRVQPTHRAGHPHHRRPRRTVAAQRFDLRCVERTSLIGLEHAFPCVERHWPRRRRRPPAASWVHDPGGRHSPSRITNNALAARCDRRRGANYARLIDLVNVEPRGLSADVPAVPEAVVISGADRPGTLIHVADV